MCPVHAAEASPLPSLRPAPAPAHLLLLLVPAAVPGAVPVTRHGAVARAAAPPVTAPATAAAGYTYYIIHDTCYMNLIHLQSYAKYNIYVRCKM